LTAAEILHRIARTVLLVPYVGDLQSRQIGVFTGSLIILAIALCSSGGSALPDPFSCWESEFSGAY
jgi:hypothetical protein